MKFQLAHIQWIYLKMIWFVLWLSTHDYSVVKCQICFKLILLYYTSPWENNTVWKVRKTCIKKSNASKEIKSFQSILKWSKSHVTSNFILWMELVVTFFFFGLLYLFSTVADLPSIKHYVLFSFISGTWDQTLPPRTDLGIL